MAIGTVIAQVRAERNMTQSELARKLYVTRQAVSRWENGESTPSIDMIKLLAVTLDIPITRLLEMPDGPVCQSCGMTMIDNGDYGRNHDGSHSSDYCKWCFDDGRFTKPSRSLEEQIEVSAKGLVEALGYSLEEAVSLMGVALPTLKRWEDVQKNEAQFGQEARALYGDDIIDASQKKTLEMDVSEWIDLEDLGNAILKKLQALLPTEDTECEDAQLLCAMHAKWIQGHWPDGLYTKETHLALAQGYLMDERFIAYYDNPCGKGATEFLVRALERYLA